MLPTFSVAADGMPNASWDDVSDPRHRIARFIGSEIYLSLTAADELLAALNAPMEREERWEWHGNSYSLVLHRNRCVIVDHYADLDGRQELEVDMDAADLSEAITQWKEFILDLGIRHH